MGSALALVEAPVDAPVIEPLRHVWPGDWRNAARTRDDTRTPRVDTPQYERPGDQAAWAKSHPQQ